MQIQIIRNIGTALTGTVSANETNENKRKNKNRNNAKGINLWQY
jgi:hypothetical protein